MNTSCVRGTGGWWFLLVGFGWFAWRADNDNASEGAARVWPRSWGRL